MAEDSLKLYNEKRNFNKTAEPEGFPEETSERLRFVVQRHAASHLHYDFRLEMDGVLKSWAIPKGPSLNPVDKRLAMMVEDHPLSYRTFEGTIPKGNYGAGEVEIWDEGFYEPLEKAAGKSDDVIMRAELHKQSMKFVMHGKKLRGEFALVKIKNSKDENSWLLIKHKDEFSTSQHFDAEDFTDENSKVTTYLNSKNPAKKSGRFKNYTPNLSGEKKLQKFIKPMLCKAAKEAFDDENWAFEIKWDGYRAIADLRNDFQLYSRNGLDFSQKFKTIFNQLKLQEHSMILDGEIIALDDLGKPNFQLLQQIGENPNVRLQYQVFDLLWLNGHSTTDLEYLQRKELLKDALKETEVIKYHDHILHNGKAFFEAAQKASLEGIIAKKTDSTYTEGARTDFWLKIKALETDDVLICGYTEPQGSRKYFGSLILGKYDEQGKLAYCGHAGTGFSDKTLKELFVRMQPLKIQQSPFEEIPTTNNPATWIEPALVAEIKFTEITRDGIYRHPVFLRLRENFDKQINPKENHKVSTTKQNIIDKKEKSGENLQSVNKKVKLTNLEKIYFPESEISKGDLIDYYQKVSEFILPHLKGRPQSMNRFPNGINGMSFYQKDAQDVPTWVKTEKIFSDSNQKDINYIICDDEETLLYLANLGCIEMNVWTSQISNLDRPNYLVLDLDPSEKNSFDEVIETAQAVKSILDKAKIEGYPKTSGKSGIHIYLPMQQVYTFEQVKNFGHLLMQFVQKSLPEITTLERSLQKRDKKKIYLDYLQNRRGQTLACAYSVRPKEGAPVSMPLDWNEVKLGLKPTDFNIGNALERLKTKGDIFLPTLDKGIDMLMAIENLQ